MILILSVDYDYSTGQVIRWLNHFQKPYVRINENDEVVIVKLNHIDFFFKFKDKIYSLSKISSIWYRRGNLNIDIMPFKIKNKKNILENYNQKEVEEILFYIHNLFKSKNSLNNFNIYHVNKLDVLRYCREHGLNKASFIVTQSKKELIDFYKNEINVISKAVNTPFVMLTGLKNYYSYTYMLSKNNIEHLPDYFTPTFFQKGIDKKYEIRTFYLEGDFYSMAIFSQNNKQTKVDFRHYDWDNPNRTMSFQLPKWYEIKIHKMLTHFKVNCASLDTLISKTNEYFMIDINPIGQFGMTSIPCNYQLEKKIAHYLAYEK